MAHNNNTDCWVDIIAHLCCFVFIEELLTNCSFLNLATAHATERGGGDTSSTPVKTDLLAFQSAMTVVLGSKMTKSK
jgi:hypothetical protein